MRPYYLSTIHDPNMYIVNEYSHEIQINCIMGNTSSKQRFKELKHHRKDAKDVDAKQPKPPKASKQPKLTATKQRLGSHDIETNQQKPAQSGQAAVPSGNRLGESSSQTQSAREAVARAAEERYRKNQEKLAGSKERLQAKNKLSKLEKNL